MKTQRNYSLLKEQEKTPEEINNEKETQSIDNEFKKLVIKMLTELRQ